MSNKAMIWVWELELKPGPKYVLAALADMAENVQFSCYPGIETLVRMTGFSRTSVKEHLKTLAERGLITRERRIRRDGSRTSNCYWLNVGGTITLEAGEDGSREDQEPESDRGVNEGQEPESGPTAMAGIVEGKGRNPEGQGPESARPFLNQKIIPSESSDIRPLPVTFEVFWRIWPRKEKRKAAEEAWRSAIKRAPAEHIVAVAAEYANHPNRPPKQFVPHGATWLRGDRWNDPMPEPDEMSPRKPSAVEQNLSVVDYFQQQEGQQQQFGLELEA